jgi:predicted dehydrogenase
MKVGIIGAGLQGGRRARAIREAGDELVAVADTNYGRAKLLADAMKCRATDKWEDLAVGKDIDIVVICTPPYLHEPIALTALRQGKHILCEKPLALNVEEARRMVAAARDNRARLKCGFNHRHHPGIIRAREWLDSGCIGEIISIRCRYGIGGRPDYEKDWRMNPEVSGGGQLMDQGMHVIDLCRWFLGDFSRVYGITTTSFWDIAPLEDNAFVLLHTDKGKTAQFHVSWTEWKNLFSLEIFGQDGYITVEGLGGSYGTERAVLGKRAFLKPFREETIEFRGEDQSWLGEWQEFTSAIIEDRDPLGSGDDGLEALRLIRAIYESAAGAKQYHLYQEVK